MKVLFVTERFPWPLEDGGNLRTFHVLKALSKNNAVTLLSHTPRMNQGSAINELEKLCTVNTVAPPNKLVSLSRILSQPWKWQKSLFVLKNWSAPLYDASRQLLKQSEFDAVHFNHLDTATFVTQQSWPKVIFDSHNCVSTMAQQLAVNSLSMWKRWLYRYESRALKAAEKAVCEQCDVVLACSEQDRNSFLQLAPKTNVNVVPNGVETAAFCRLAQPELHRSGRDLIPRIVFTGAMDYSPNVIGVDWFCKKVLPLIQKQRPNVLFQIVGRNPTARVQKWNNHAAPEQDTPHFGDDEKVGIEVTGRVESVQPYLEQAAVVVVPLLDGGGTRLKILEAFAAQRAVVSTSKGAEGIDAVPGKDILLADDPESFANEVLRLLDNPAAANQIAKAGHQLAVQQYDWKSIDKQISKVVRGLQKQDQSIKVTERKPNLRFSQKGMKLLKKVNG